MKTFSRVFLMVALFVGVYGYAAAEEVIFFEDFESGGFDWITDNGVWQIGDPTYGPLEAHSPVNCAGTVLDGNYYAYQDSRLIYPKPSLLGVPLPEVMGDEEIHLNFWNWFSYSSYDAGYLQIAVWDEDNLEWGAWEDVPFFKPVKEGYGKWTYRGGDITSYAGSTIKFAFYHTADRNSWGDPSESSGWYIDDVIIVKKVPVFTGDFEAGKGDWMTQDALFETGYPTVGPAPYKGAKCSGTVLDGNYPGYKDCRFISPTVRLSEKDVNGKIWLSYYQWWSYSSYDYGYLQITVLDEATGLWSEWEDLADTTVSGTSMVWSLGEVELTEYADKKVRVAFYHTANRNSWGDPSESSGWYIDSVEITGVTSPSLALLADTHKLPVGGGTIDFELYAGLEKANRPYLVLVGATGTEPGFPLPGGACTMPLNWDVLTDTVLTYTLMGSPMFVDFIGTLDAVGKADARFNAPAVDPMYEGTLIYFAFCLGWPWEFASNAVEIELIP